MTNPEPDWALDAVYGGRLVDPKGVGQRLYDGTMTPDEFNTLFTVYDPRNRGTLPSLGMFITVRMTYLLLMDGLADWTRTIAGNMAENRQVRDWLRAALHPVKHYTHDAAIVAMREAPQVRRVLIAGTLMNFGFAACKGWVGEAAKILNRPDRNVVGEMIVQHLQEAHVSELRSFVGVNPQYDPSELIGALNNDQRAICATLVANRTPQLFIYHAYKLGVTDEELLAMFQWIIYCGFHFTEEQKLELVDAPWMPENLRDFLRDKAKWGAS